MVFEDPALRTIWLTGILDLELLRVFAHFEATGSCAASVSLPPL